MILAETSHRMTRRLNGWDYCQRSIYMITVTLAERSREWLGHLETRAENGAGKWVVAPTPHGFAVLDALAEMPRLYPQVRILAQQLMPEHFHFVMFVREQLPKPLGALVRGFKAGAAKRWKAIAENGEALNGSVPGHSCPDSPSWAEGFKDTIIFREGQLAKEIEYLRSNPDRLAEKRANPELFRRVASLELPLDGGRLIGRASTPPR